MTKSGGATRTLIILFIVFIVLSWVLETLYLVLCAWALMAIVSSKRVRKLARSASNAHFVRGFCTGLRVLTYLFKINPRSAFGRRAVPHFQEIVAAYLLLLIISCSWQALLILYVRRMLRPRGDSISAPPGTCLRQFAEFVFSAKSYRRVFKPLCDDIDCEYIDALSAHRKFKARWVRIRGHITFWKTVAVHCSVSSVFAIVKAFRLS